MNTDIPDILKKYNLDINYIINDKNFPLKERKLPDICADRIDYLMRWMFHYENRNTIEIEEIISHLIIKDENRIFDNIRYAQKYTETFAKGNDKYMSSIRAAAMFQTVGDCLKYAWTKGYLQKEDFYTTDQHVLDKIISHIEHDEQLNMYRQRMNNKIPFKNDPNDFEVQVICKNRIVDPLFMDGDKIKRLSDVDNERKLIVQK